MAVRTAHDAAVRAALEYLEEHAAFSRQGKAGIRQVDTEGLVAASFVHRSSRAGDPQLHTHVLVSGRVRCHDGEWRALDSRALHRELKTAGMLYQAALRAELSAQMGVEWSTADRNGQAEIAGVPEGLCRHYSTRRKVIEERASERITESEAVLGRGLTPEERRRAYERATLETRTAKAHEEVSHQGLHDRWRAEAEAAGFDPEHWAASVAGRSAGHHEVDLERITAVALAELAERSSTWGRTDVVRQLARRLPPTVGGAEAAVSVVEDLADAVLADRSVVRLAAPAARPPSDLRRRDGRSVFEAHGAPRFSTLATLAIEQQVLDAALAGRDAGRSVADPHASDVAIEAHGLDDDQATAVRRLTLGGEAIACMVGPAGAGKSRAMGAAAQAWSDSGIAVRGLAVSAAAAGVLKAEAGIASETIAKFLYEQDRPNGPTDRWRIRRGEVLVVDEAAMVSSADLARVVNLATGAEAKVVLVGDHRQLGAVEAGGLFRLLAADTDAAELSGVRRFHSPWEREASLGLRQHDPAVIDEYLARGRVVGGERQVMVDEAFERWRWARAKGESVVVCATDHHTVDELANRARAERVAAGEVEAGGVVASAHTVGVGDEIVTTRNDRRLLTTGGGWVRNGDRWRVLARKDDDALVVEDLAGRGQTMLPRDYVAEAVSLAYAVTIHKAQGLTVDHAILVVDENTTAEGLYVGMTRGRSTNVALAVCDEADVEHQPAGPARTPIEVLLGALRRSTAEQAGLEALREAFAASESLATLAPRLANLDASIAKQMPPDRSRELQGASEALDHARRFCRPGHLTRSGREGRRRLEAAEARYDSVAAEESRRQAWLEAHVDTLAYRDQLAESVAERRHELGIAAAVAQPNHIIDLIGAVPTDSPDALAFWTNTAARIEAYREEWGVAPEQLRERPHDTCQGSAWDQAIHTAVMIARLPGRTLDRGLGTGLGLSS